MSASKIEFKKIRTVNQTVTTAIDFIRQNWRFIISCIVVYALPLLLIGGILYAYSMQSMVVDSDYSENSVDIYSQQIFSPLYLLGMFFISVGGIIFTAIQYEYLLQYTRSNTPEHITKSEVIQGTWQHIGRVISTIFLLGLIFLAMLTPIALLFALGISITNVILIAMVTFLTYVIFIYVAIAIAPIVYIRIEDENIGIVDALKRCFYLIKGYWWSSFGLYILLGLISLAIYIAPMFIISIFMGISSSIGMSSSLSIIMAVLSGVLYILGTVIGQILILTGAIIRYHSLSELKEGNTARQRISQIGVNDNFYETKDNFNEN